MEQIYISNLNIERVRHLEDISIPVSDAGLKHLIFTGKNGSGKTSVLKALEAYLKVLAGVKHWEVNDFLINHAEHEAGLTDLDKADFITKNRLADEAMKNYFSAFRDNEMDVCAEFNKNKLEFIECYRTGQLVLASYKAEREFHAQQPKHIEKAELQDVYEMDEIPGKEFVKYLADLKVTEALARNSGKYEKAEAIGRWFERFQELLRTIFADNSLELVFNEDTFSFAIKEKNRNSFSFNELSSGFAAVLDIVLDLIIRMEKQTNHSFDFYIPGIVLIDEIEAHLHLEMQRTILGMLTAMFPNIQFIVSTHSPFILNSISNAVIYDLEKKMIVKDGLSNVPYGGIVEGYFQADEMSVSLREKFDRYQYLVKKKDLTDDDFEEIAELEMFLNEIPDYLALNLTTEYQRLKLEFEHREDV